MTVRDLLQAGIFSIAVWEITQQTIKLFDIIFMPLHFSSIFQRRDIYRRNCMEKKVTWALVYREKMAD